MAIIAKQENVGQAHAEGQFENRAFSGYTSGGKRREARNKIGKTFTYRQEKIIR